MTKTQDELKAAVERLERMIGPRWDKEPRTSSDIRLILATPRSPRHAA